MFVPPLLITSIHRQIQHLNSSFFKHVNKVKKVKNSNVLLIMSMNYLNLLNNNNNINEVDVNNAHVFNVNHVHDV